MSSRTDDGYYEAYWPRTRRRTAISALAPRLDTLNGKIIAQLWDYLFRGDEVFAVLATVLKQRFPAVRFIHWSEFGSTHGKNERAFLASLPARLKALRVDAVISGLGC
ncbi:MAG: hypothetical protein IT531_00900 [Burkholderiales bacterium]|nr:hypothetical protein [Burkholderiales bacterium]